MDARQAAIGRHLAAFKLSLDLPSPEALLIKRGRAYLSTGTWHKALDDANQAITLDPFSPWGYEIKYTASHNTRDFDGAIAAFEAMLSTLEQSSDPKLQQLADQYIRPSSTRADIRKVVQKTIRRLPRVLINTADGCLYSKGELASAFESLQIFKELVSSMTKRTDYVRIKQEVRWYFRYVTLSHRWEGAEPSFQQVLNISVFDLKPSPTHDKLRRFCEIVQDVGILWAWSDTCCIDRSSHYAVEEALVAMFRWYRGSELTIVYLRGVTSLSPLGALVRSIWNSRAWTLQEYIAAKVIRFYTEDWTPYLGLKLSNHKDSPEVISEMEEVTGMSATALKSLRPGLSDIREKLRLASTRHTSIPEDAAYSLFGIFSTTIPMAYGEGGMALSRLLGNVLTASGDVSILAWTGETGLFNSCLPKRINAFNMPPTSHLPSPIPSREMEAILITLRASSFDLDAAVKLYECLNSLAAPMFSGKRMKLPCIAIQLPRLQPFREGSLRIYHVDTDAFGEVEIRTRQDLSGMTTLYLVHPWLQSLLEHADVHSGASEELSSVPRLTDDEEMSDDGTSDEDLGHSASLLVPPSPSMPVEQPVRMDDETRARRLVVRLRQPFGALLLAPVGSGEDADHLRVATDSEIRVQFRQMFSMAEVLERVRVFDVL